MTKQYCITDPTYILPQEVKDRIWEEWRKLGDDNDWDTFHRMEEQALSEFTNGGQAFVENTGFGDWENCIYGPGHDGGEESTFTADSGEVCVCEYTDAVKEKLDSYPNPNIAAVFDAVGPISVHFNTKDPNWTMVEIVDADGNIWSSFEPESEDEESEE